MSEHAISPSRFDQTIKSNVGLSIHFSTLTLTALPIKIIEVMNKSLAFHTSVNYQIQAPQPFSNDVHENLPMDLARISQQDYYSEYDLHVDLSHTFKRLNDGHCV